MNVVLTTLLFEKKNKQFSFQEKERKYQRKYKICNNYLHVSV